MRTIALGLDVGTSGARVLAVDDSGAVIAETTQSHPLLTPQPGWTEQNPSDWWQASCQALQEMMSKLSEHTVVGIGMAGQMHGMTPLDAHGEVVRPAMLWNDQRTGDAVTSIDQAVGRSTLIERGGNPAITGFQLPKLVWLRDSEPDAFAKTRHVLFPKDYITYKLTGEMIAEPADASGSNCFHLASKRWDAEVLGAVGVDTSLFPEVLASHDVAGKVTADAAAASGLPEGLPVIAGAGDNASAAFGLGLSKDNLSLGSLSLGTSGVIFAPLETATPDPDGRVHLFCHADGGYNLLGVTLAAAGSFQWYRDTFYPERSFDDLTQLAQTSQPGAGGVTFKPYLAGERTPHMNPDLRGSWTGLSLATTQADVVRAVLEGVAYSLRDTLDVIRPLANVTELLTTGGGSTSDFWLQIVSDVLETPLKQPQFNQGVAYGAALLAFWGSGQPVVSNAQTTTHQFLPASNSAYAKALARYQALN
ncbi:MAG: xylulokinase [Deinococcota bacterium]